MRGDEGERLLSWLFERTRGPLAWADRRLFAVLDGARDPAIYEALQATRLPWRSLFDGVLDPALAPSVPHLVELERYDPLAHLLATRGWHDHWGIFAVSPVDLDTTRRQLRRCLRVVDEERRQLLFRYYDPRVLRAYLPTCTRDELELVFGPLAGFIAPAEDSDDALHFEVRAGVLCTESVRWRDHSPTK